MADLTIEYVPVDDLADDPANPKAHHVAEIAASILRLGFAEPAIRDGRTGRLAAGHGRKKALLALRDDPDVGEVPTGIRVDDDGRWLVPVVDGWASEDDDAALAALVALNETTIAGGYDEPALLEVLDRLSTLDQGFAGTGYDLDAYTELRDRLAAADGPEPAEDRGTVLEVVDVTLPDPTITPDRGTVWALGHHLLVVADVVDQWDRWVHLLDPGRLLIPYPGLYVALAERADTTPLLLVQPDPFTAGVIMDRWSEVHGGTPEQVTG